MIYFAVQRIHAAVDTFNDSFIYHAGFLFSGLHKLEAGGSEYRDKTIAILHF